LTNLVIDYEVVGRGRRDGGFYGLQQQAQQSCDDVFVYITDTTNSGIVVYDVRGDAAWRVFHPSMLPHPDYSTYNVSTGPTSRSSSQHPSPWPYSQYMTVFTAMWLLYEFPSTRFPISSFM
jgi:hypothetical protein